ncbi:hypothetical protein IWX76_002263 [Pedobacter sp. CAN_A7]|uniref:DUF1801 domain-containing protein n=1 Tax=Pedobacter sp. CAN_A7 TaxID=2787722 RepID=UPI0018C99D9A
MATNKTMETSASVAEFIAAVENEQQRKDSDELIKMMKTVTAQEPKMWGPSIIGFGSYHYKYDSGHEGDAPLIGFSPRKTAISLYVFTGLEEHKPLLEGMGKFKMGKACIYVKKLQDLHEDKLMEVMKETITFLTSRYGS